MGYILGKTKRKNGEGWRLLHRQYVKEPITNFYRPTWRHVPETEYARLGIHKDMTREEVRAIIKQCNASNELRRRENVRNRIRGRIKLDMTIECAHLPEVFVNKFEQTHLPTRYLGNEPRLQKVLKLWVAAKKVILTIERPMDQWWRYPEPFYAYFEKRAYSPGYVDNILTALNAWLDFLGAEQNKHYRPVPAPSTVWAARLADAFEESGKSKSSLPLTPEMLKAAQQKKPFTPGHYNWLYVTVWAGLRPNEVSALLNKKRTRIRYQDGTPILEVYQAKLKNVPKREDRWKYIPLFLKEQQHILEIIESGVLEEPLAKTISERWPGCFQYAGRKGFHELMVTRYGQPELEVVRWLGHRSLDMAMKHYAKRGSVRWKKVA